MARCALCRCIARAEVYGFKVCRYHVHYGESDPPCPYCSRSLFETRWTYTPHGHLMSTTKVERRQVKLPNTIFFDHSTEAIVKVEVVKEPVPFHRSKMRPSVVVIGLGQQLGQNFFITQWASDWERELFNAARPSLALAARIYSDAHNRWDLKALAGHLGSHVPTWPTMDVLDKAVDVRSVLRQQDIPSQLLDVVEDHKQFDVARAWKAGQKEDVLKFNYFRVLDAAMRVFQIEWPTEQADA